VCLYQTREGVSESKRGVPVSRAKRKCGCGDRDEWLVTDPSFRDFDGGMCGPFRQARAGNG
jgi:hypothetical protein